MEKTYIPQPVDTSDVQLPEELNQLAEEISKAEASIDEAETVEEVSEAVKTAKEKIDAIKTYLKLYLSELYRLTVFSQSSGTLI